VLRRRMVEGHVTGCVGGEGSMGAIKMGVGVHGVSW